MSNKRTRVSALQVVGQARPTSMETFGKTYLIFACLVVSVPVFAQDAARYHACIEKAVTQPEMNECAREEAAGVDGELNDVYRKLLSKAALNPETLPKVKAAEKAWIAYRDAYLEATYPAKDKQLEYGTIYPMEVDLLRAKLTRRQVEALRELLKQYDGVGYPGSRSPET